MNSEDARWNRRLVLLIGLSFLLCAVAVVLRVGLGATPYETTDSGGRPMGFNDPLYAEHYVLPAGRAGPFGSVHGRLSAHPCHGATANGRTKFLARIVGPCFQPFRPCLCISQFASRA